MTRANDPTRRSWVPISEDSDFSIQNLPFGIFSRKGSAERRVGVALGEFVIDLVALSEFGYLNNAGVDPSVFRSEELNQLLKYGKSTLRELRNIISDTFIESSDLKTRSEQHQHILVPQSDVQLHLPVKVGDYTDFYSSMDHARNVGTMFRDPANALLPNWKHLPVAYHGRASSIRPSGESFHRPKGQLCPDETKPPVFGPSKMIDFELEMAFITFDGKPLGDSISTQEADDYIFGLVIFNDWSARDIQKWEYVPLGPFLAKNFMSSISPWVVTLDALEPFRVNGPVQDPPVLPYLEYSGDKHVDVNLEVDIVLASGQSVTVSKSNLKYMYWNMNQQLAHHTVNGCNINRGDMMASGTISGPTPDSYGSMLELAWRGTKPLTMPDGTERRFILDGDTVVMRGYGLNNGVRVGFGEVRSTVLPAK